MTFKTRQETTWGDLREGERIVDKNDVTWVLGRPEPVGDSIRVAISGTRLMPNEGKSVVVVKPATDTVTVIREAGAEKQVNDVFEEQLAEAMERPLDHEILTGAKATVEDAFGPTVEVLPVIDTALELRSHLYLCHNLLIHEATTRAALLEHHRRSHQLEDEGKGEKGYTPHVHEAVQGEGL